MKTILFSYFPSFVLFNHGAALLTAICKNAGIEADYSALYPGWYDKMKDYDIIGFSFVTDPDYIASIPYMMAANQEGKIVLAGGTYARRGAYIHPDLVDFVCRGEGENLPDYIINGDTSLFESKQLCENIDALPAPDFTHLTGYEFDRGYPFLQRLRIFPYQTSRGCGYHNCSFCDMQFQPKGVRIKHTIREDLELLVNTYRPDLVYLMDTTAPYHLKEWRDQWEGIDIPFQVYIRADISEYELEFLISHGLKFAPFGIESGSEKFRNEVLNKGVTDEDIWRTVSILRKYNVAYAPFFMVNMPGETMEDKMATKDMMNKVGGWPMIFQYQDLSMSVRAAEAMNKDRKKLEIMN